MSNWELYHFGKDLSEFLRLIEANSVPGDFSDLYMLHGKLSEMVSMEYSLSNVCFFLKRRISGTTPLELKSYQIFLNNELRLKDSYNPNEDPINGYKFEININGYLNSEKNGECYKSCWHLDKHLDSNEPKYTHPYYHFHFGGEYIENLDSGNISIFSTPRLPHPPMDIFLGFHFIMCNFFSSKDYDFVNQLKNDFNYQQIIKRAQERLWKPYFGAFNPTNTHSDFTITNVFPLYIN